MNACSKFSIQPDTPASPSIRASRTSKSCRVRSCFIIKLFVTDCVIRVCKVWKHGCQFWPGGDDDRRYGGKISKYIPEGHSPLALGTTSSTQPPARGGVQLLEEEFPDDALATAPPTSPTNHADDATGVSISPVTARLTLLNISSRAALSLHGQCAHL